nr:hypothetical protein [Tanacetum cinerariifolium]
VSQVIPQVAYQSPQAPTQLMTESPFVDSGFAVPVLSLGDDPIACLNKAMAFLVAVASSRQGLLNATTIKVKDIWLGNALSLSDKGMLPDSGIPAEVPNSDNYLNDIDNQSVHALKDFKQSPDMDFTDNEISSDSNIIPYSQYFQETQHATVQDTNLQAQQDSIILSAIEQMSEQKINHVNNWEKANKEQNKESITAELERYKKRVKTFKQRLNIDLNSREKMIDSQMDDMIKEMLALKEKLDSLEQNLSKQITEKECYQNPFYLKKARRMKPTLYDGIVISEKHVAMHVIVNEETLLLEEESQSKMSEKAKEPEVIAKKISHKPIDYEKSNRLTNDFGKRFTPQQELSTEQAF